MPRIADSHVRVSISPKTRKKTSECGYRSYQRPFNKPLVIHIQITSGCAYNAGERDGTSDLSLACRGCEDARMTGFREIIEVVMSVRRLGEGGTWDGFVHLLLKYRLVPPGDTQISNEIPYKQSVRLNNPLAYHSLLPPLSAGQIKPSNATWQSLAVPSGVEIIDLKATARFTSEKQVGKGLISPIKEPTSKEEGTSLYMVEAMLIKLKMGNNLYHPSNPPAQPVEFDVLPREWVLKSWPYSRKAEGIAASRPSIESEKVFGLIVSFDSRVAAARLFTTLLVLPDDESPSECGYRGFNALQNHSLSISAGACTAREGETVRVV
ncbi:hypothetical protein BDP27DRAFT_1401431 [Rhodocollybia butyracea]|uniref:Uncharacterized protein n=1 Tax=Rhodocollybia butyracea TaxID=206335 RepID=A0A9P5U9V6_9AGAR|nr:hypothetical protein BDP27DRAFT_1401431 [Rhodocollybia butyracea]